MWRKTTINRQQKISLKILINIQNKNTRDLRYYKRYTEYIYTSIYIICKYVCMYVHMYACMHVCIIRDKI